MISDTGTVRDSSSPLDVVDDPMVDTGPVLPDVPGAMTCTLTAPTIASGHLTLDGRHLRDSLGRQVILRGANFGGRSKFQPFFPFEFRDDTEFNTKLNATLDTLSTWGVNVLRLPFTWEAVESVQGQWEESFFTHYRTMLDAAWAHGMRVVVDMHQDVYAQVFCGDGFPVWTLGSIPHGAPSHDCSGWFNQYFDTTSGVSMAFDRLWANQDGIADAMLRMWREVSTRFGAHPAVMGFEIINEPSPGTMDPAVFGSTTLPAFTLRMGNAITANAPDALIVQGGPGTEALGGASQLANIAHSKFMYAPHFYDPLVIFGGGYVNPRASRARLETTLALGESWNRPVLLGEYGAASNGLDGGRFFRDVYDLLDAHLAHATVWEVSRTAELWNRENLGLLDPQGNEKPFVKDIVRGFPLAVDGAIVSTTWDAVTNTMVLRVRNAGTGVTEVFLPTRHVGQMPRLGLTSGCVQWNATTQRLLVKPMSADWTLTVAP